MGCTGGCGKTDIQILASKIGSIARGWSNIIWSSKEIKAMAYARIEVCAKCDKNVGKTCMDCGCWIPAKARSPKETCKFWE